ncbi:MAG: 3'(2'),5'-bisphosphate nucleotidase CysQ [Pseudomonadota bacterium]
MKSNEPDNTSAAASEAGGMKPVRRPVGAAERSDDHISDRPIVDMGDGALVIDRWRLADALLPGVLAAGRLEIDAWDDEDLCVQMKTDRTPVTIADHQAEEVIHAALQKVAPGILVIGEETHGANRKPNSGEPFFLVDPLDGTRDFIDHLPQFTVNVALIDHGRPMFGMIFAPALDLLFVTTGVGHAIMADVACRKSLKQLASYMPQTIHTRPSDPENLKAFASRSHMDAVTGDILQKIGKCKPIQIGSSLKFCLIAQGEGDVYVRHGPTSEWDTAAGEAILEAAGGTVTTLDGKKLTYGGANGGYLNPDFVAWGDPDLISSFDI